MAANELKKLVAQRVELMAKRELADAQHAEAVESIDREMLTLLEAIATCVSAPDVKLPSKKRAAKNTRRPDHDAIAKKYADFEPAASGCLCGCGEDVDEHVNFVKGHQKRLQSIAMAVEAGKLGPEKMSMPGLEYASGQRWVENEE